MASTGAGWRDLAAAGWDAATAAGMNVVQVKEKWARLRIYVEHRGDEDPAVAQRLRAQLAAIERASARVCEACGRPGRVWGETEEERARISDATGRRSIWLKTLCASCGYRYYFEQARGWPAIRGEWRPDADEDDIDSDGDLR
ncbi:MAG: hypothetical protein KGL93_11230 [Gemmatimonadota bacterium]|nr:hypothetical protein [Gemmatimonadota bacterium]